MAISWQNVYPIASHQYKCGFCGNKVASSLGVMDVTTVAAFVRICPHCSKPTFFHNDRQVPGAAFGNEVANLPPDIAALYQEARGAVQATCYTAAVLICRKLLMNIAVAQKAAPDLKFIEYVEYLARSGYVPPNGKGWVDHIRKKGNEATHEIQLMTRVDAEELISFSEMLLKFVYEFPSKVPQATP